MASRPQTLYGIADSPVGLAAWLLDHNDADGQPAAAVVAALSRSTSDTGELTRDEVLDNITLYWLTNTGVSTSRLYWEYQGGFFNAKGVSIPVAVSVFPGEQYQARGAGPSRRIPTSSTTTRSTRAAISPLGSSRSSSPRSSEPRSGRFGRASAWVTRRVHVGDAGSRNLVTRFATARAGPYRPSTASTTVAPAVTPTDARGQHPCRTPSPRTGRQAARLIARPSRDRRRMGALDVDWLHRRHGQRRPPSYARSS